MKKAIPFLYITLVFLIAFLPILSFVFALKNDFFLGYFPPKFLLSETISSGQLPLWNPYISFGLPFYADMNGAYWNPITWLIAGTTGYNAFTITIELLLYILIGGAGMFKLSGFLTQNKYIQLSAAFAYMCNGFVIGHLQHLNWISAAAFIPCCIWGLLKINESASLRNISITSLFFYFLLSSSHPGMIISSIYFFGAFILFLVYNRYHNSEKKIIRAAKPFLLLLGLTIVLSAGLMAGYTDILPYFARSGKVDLSLSLSQNTSIESWVSFLLPFSTVKNQAFFENDIALRNNYIGILYFLFLVLTFITAKTKMQWFFLLTGIFFLLLSLGGGFKLFAHNYLPLIGYVRVNGEFRIFALISFLITAVSCLHFYAANPAELKRKIKPLILLTGLFFLIALIYSIVKITQGETFFSAAIADNSDGWRNQLKKIIDGLSFYDAILFQCFIQLLLLGALWIAIKKFQLKAVTIITAVDLIAATLLCLPFTGVGKVSVAKIHSIHQQSPDGIPVPSLEPMKAHTMISNKDSALVGDWSFYNKQIGKATSVLYPVKISDNLLFYERVKKDSSLSVAELPFLFLTKSVAGPVFTNQQNINAENLKKFTTNGMQLNFVAEENGYLVILQNYYPHWFYIANGDTNKVQKAGIAFMAIPVQKGENDIKVFFQPTLIITLFWLSAFLFVLLCVFLCLPKYNLKLIV